MNDYEGIYKGPSDPLPDVTTVMELRAALARVERERDEARWTMRGLAEQLATAEAERDALRAQVEALTDEQVENLAVDAAEAVIHANRRYALGHPSRKALWVDARDEAYDIVRAVIPILAAARDAAAANAPEQATEDQR
jgi:hypothetical protein